MLVYRSGGLRLAEVWFDEPDRGIDADIVRYMQALSPPAGTACVPFWTLVVDLARPEAEILAGMSSETRYEIRRAAQKDLVRCAGTTAPDAELLGRLRSTHDEFAREQGLPPLPRKALERLAAARQLDVSWAAADGAGDLLFHAHVVVGSRARLLRSVATARAGADPGRRAFVGRANRLLHWEDIVRFRARGVRTYDFGGWYDGSTDAKKLGINRFKESFGGAVEKHYNAERLLTARARVAVAVAHLIGRRRSGRIGGHGHRPPTSTM